MAAPKRTPDHDEVLRLAVALLGPANANCTLEDSKIKIRASWTGGIGNASDPPDWVKVAVRTQNRWRLVVEKSIRLGLPHITIGSSRWAAMAAKELRSRLPLEGLAAVL